MNQIVKQHIGPTFGEKVLEAALSIPSGRVTTYGHISRAAGGTAPMQARAVTGILANYAKQGFDIPWHRIVYAGGRVWMSDEYYTERMKLYKQEGIEVDQKGKIRNFNDIVHTFD